VTVGVVAADGKKCERCWNYSAHVGASTEHPGLCERCASVVINLPNAPKPSAVASTA